MQYGADYIMGYKSTGASSDEQSIASGWGRDAWLVFVHLEGDSR